MARPRLSITIISLNEEEHIARAIQSAAWADEVLVIDSGSTDRTVAIAQSLGAKVITHAWPGYGPQKNFAQANASHDWVLNLDADEAISEASRLEIEATLEKVGRGEVQAVGFRFPRKNFYLGHWIRHGGWYPNYLVRLGQKSLIRWSEPSVHEELLVQGEIGTMTEPLLHYSFTHLQDQVTTNLRFSKLGAEELKKANRSVTLAHLIWKPVGKFFETYFLKRGFQDGLPGFIISVNAAYSMFLKYAYTLEEGIKNADPDHRQ